MGRFPSPKNFLKTYTKNLTNPLEISEMFIDGFRLGAKMVIEIYGNDITDEK